MNNSDRVFLIMPPSLKGALEAAAQTSTAFDWMDDDGSRLADLEWAIEQGLVQATRNGKNLTGRQALEACDKDTAITLTDKGRAWLSVARLSTPVRISA